MQEILEDLEKAIQQEIAKNGTGPSTYGGPLDHLIAAENFAGDEDWKSVRYHLEEAGDSGAGVLGKYKALLQGAP